MFLLKPLCLKLRALKWTTKFTEEVNLLPTLKENSPKGPWPPLLNLLRYLSGNGKRQWLRFKTNFQPPLDMYIVNYREDGQLSTELDLLKLEKSKVTDKVVSTHRVGSTTQGFTHAHASRIYIKQ